MPKRTTIPEWFSDVPDRLIDVPFPVRLGVSSDNNIERIATELGWSKARVIRVLLRKALRDFDQE